ncbi:DEAD/DEAH box helicase [Dactylosporangium sp. AC04546]|uniref:DEAD/DEAH box helicase n=1 Tax=Dactylosporangium sp. AC04546 TaxID=2862460 RepID=UPI001EDFCF22|nr:DEAD/DEAH box helicase [Dactylosporangium sp. AC04546]WVK89425.1 DEAD/DEAH box helicase [Dactylosporangium sp. AC04546]
MEHLPPRPGTPAPWPDWVPPLLRSSLGSRDITAPWRHQAEAATSAWQGTHTVVATGTGSGKSLAYQLPALSTLLTDDRATALYIAPTKALAADQLRSLLALDLPGVRPATYDGDTSREERDWVRQHARVVLTNPDMLHHGILPGHASWSRFLRGLRYVIVDESHAYRGVFGSHVAHVLRRLRRMAARYRTTPTFILASATSGDPVRTGTRMTGLPVTAFTEDTSPRGGITFALWEPPLLPASPALPSASSSPGFSAPASPASSSHDGDAPTRPRDAEPVRRSALRETADLLADAVAAGIRTLAFIRSRKGAELVATMARRSLDTAVPGLGTRVAAYRSGYLREDRRALERDLLDGTLLGLASTNALELGVDLVGLDAVLISGYPGTLASLWQQAGRAGRAGRDATCVLIARDDPLDTYLVHHPEALFGRPVEATVFDPGNPHVLAPQLCCAAAELPLTPADLPLFGPTAEPTLDALVAAGILRKRPSGWYWTERHRPDVDLRGAGGGPVAVVESATGRLLGTVDTGSAHHQVHDGAVYLHQGTTYVVDKLDLADSVALVHAEDPDWSTHPRDVTDVTVLSVRETRTAGPVTLSLGEVEVTSQVVSYQRRRLVSGEVIDVCELDLPQRVLRTVAVWWTVTPEALDAAGVPDVDWPGALHAAEHASIGLLPLVATCDRWDIGGLSTAFHADTGLPTVFVYDGHPGGAGFAERAFEVATDWLSATRTVVAECRCDQGCPSCVQSPKCGNGNNPLGKADAVTVLSLVLSALSREPARRATDLAA